jgi:hypothetical protein
LTDATCEVALRVDVDEQHTLIGHRQGCGEVDGRCGLADSTFLVGHRHDLRHKLFILNSYMRPLIAG